MKIFTPEAVKLGSTQIGQITEVSRNSAFDELMRSATGTVENAAVITPGVDHRFSFTTENLYAALNSVAGLNGAQISSGSPFVVAYKALENKATVVTTDYATLTASDGIIYPTTMAASQGATGTIGYEAIAQSSDGQTSPLAKATGAALTYSTQADKFFTVGPVEINGAAYDGVQSISVNFGIDVQIRRAKGDVYVSHTAIRAQRPTITISGFDIEQFASSAMGTDGIGSATVELWFRGCEVGALPYADASAQHIKITAYDSRVKISGESGSSGEGNDDVTNEIMVMPTKPTGASSFFTTAIGVAIS